MVARVLATCGPNFRRESAGPPADRLAGASEARFGLADDWFRDEVLA